MPQGTLPDTSPLPRCRGPIQALWGFLAGLLFAALAEAQPAPRVATPIPQPPLSSILDATTLADLPLADNIYTALETTQAEVIGDRFSSGGLNVGEVSRVGGFLGSWSQTLFRIGDIDVSDPAGGGGSLLFPESLFWERVEITHGLMPADLNTAGLAVTLVPLQPTEQWTTRAYGSGSGGSLASPAPKGPVPPIARLDDWARLTALVSGPVIANRLGIVTGGTWTQASKLTRAVASAADSDLASGFVHLVYTPSATTDVRTVGWVQRARVPFEFRHVFGNAAAQTRDLSGHLQTTWEHRQPAALNWRLVGGVTTRSRATALGLVGSPISDRLFDGPVPSIVSATGDTSTRRWAFGARVAPASPPSSRHTPSLNLNLDHSQLRTSDQFRGLLGEQVDGVPARAWAFAHPEATSRRHATAVAAFVTDRIVLSPAQTLDVALRFESVTGSASGASQGVTWNTWLPTAHLRKQFGDEGRLVGLAGYRRSANRLNLDLLAYGDPAAPTAVVSRWLPFPLAAPAAIGPLVDRVGPGTGGDQTFSRIAPNLKRPVTDEYVLGLDSQQLSWLRVGLTGILRRETNLIGAVDVGVPLGSYTTLGVPDPGRDFVTAEDDQIVTVYSRIPATFGQNRYLLTNPGQQAATAYALKLTAESSFDRLFMLFGATAATGTGAAGYRGYGPLENDQDAVGEVFTNPNAESSARGRLFADRAFTIKWTTVYRFPWDLRVGAVARYQDGQPFARLIVAPGLNQGADFVRAYPNGVNRFTFTGTLDVRVQKGFAVGRTRLDAVADFYNFVTRSNEVEEYVVTGPRFREETALEPLHSMHLGVRVTF